MNGELFDRRQEMLALHEQGFKASEWVPQIASKYHVTEDSVKKDWTRRRNWVHYFLKLEDATSLVKKLISDNEVLLLDATNLYEQTEEPKIKLQMMWLRLKIYHERVITLKEIGAFGPIQVEFKKQTREYTHKLDLEKYPYLKGEDDYRIRQEALKKSTQDRAYYDCG